jgi:uncharacterized protein
MGGLLDLAATNLTSPAILCFALGLAAALARSDLSVPEAAAKALSLYLLFAIGFKGGAGVAAHGMDARLVGALVAGVALSAAIPLVAFGYLRAISRLSQTDAAAVAAHYGSISIVTFVAGTATVQAAGLMAEPYMVAVAAAMEAPAILTALWLAHRGRAPDPADESGGSLMREVLLNGSIVLLVGAFAIGWITGERGLAQIDSFIVAPFLGVLCLFLLDMGLVAGRGLRGSRGVITMPLVLFGVTMPLIGAAFGLAAALAVGLSAGGAALMMTLAASASYIAVPAAMRVALPEANPAIYLTLALGVTFPFNLTIGLPLYMAVAAALIQG